MSASPRLAIDSCLVVKELARESSLAPSVNPSIDNPNKFETPIPTRAEIIVVPRRIRTTEKPTFPNAATSFILTTAAIIIVNTNGMITILKRLT